MSVISSRTRWFAVQRKSTKRLLPAPPAMQRGGQTHISFEEKGPPRLFPTAAGANVAMKLWLQGDWRRPDHQYDHAKGRYSGKVQFQNSRMHLTDDVHIVEVEVSIASLDQPETPIEVPDWDDDL